MKYFVIAAAAVGLSAQQLDLSALDRLADRASESANVTLDGEKLKLASQLFSAEEGKKAKVLVEGLKGVFVRQFEFAKPGEFTSADLEPIRQQLKAPGWSSVISVKEKNESAEIYFFSQNGQFGGLAVVATEPREVAVVNIVGPLDLASLVKVAESFGADVDLGPLGGSQKSKSKAKPAPQPAPQPAKDDEDEI